MINSFIAIFIIVIISFVLCGFISEINVEKNIYKVIKSMFLILTGFLLPLFGMMIGPMTTLCGEQTVLSEKIVKTEEIKEIKEQSDIYEISSENICVLSKYYNVCIYENNDEYSNIIIKKEQKVKHNFSIFYDKTDYTCYDVYVPKDIVEQMKPRILYSN